MLTVSHKTIVIEESSMMEGIGFSRCLKGNERTRNQV